MLARFRRSLLVIAAAVSACAVPEFGGFGSNAGTGGAGAEAGAGGAAGATGAGGSAGAGATGATDGGSDAEGGPVGCSSHADCQEPGLPKCDTSTGQCVHCLPSEDECPDGQYCRASNLRCTFGCKTSAECNTGNDAGVFTCDPATHKCLGCTADSDCAPGNICNTDTTECVPGCTPEHACPSGEDCCSGACKNLLFDEAHCGTCDNPCEAAPNATGECSIGNCQLRCDPFMADCNDTYADGCEVDVRTDPDNCASCGTKCGANQTCVDRQCR